MCGRTRGSAWRCEKTNSSPGLETLCIRSVDLELVYGDSHQALVGPAGKRVHPLQTFPSFSLSVGPVAEGKAEEGKEEEDDKGGEETAAAASAGQ